MRMACASCATGLAPADPREFGAVAQSSLSAFGRQLKTRELRASFDRSGVEGPAISVARGVGGAVKLLCQAEGWDAPISDCHQMPRLPNSAISSTSAGAIVSASASLRVTQHAASWTVSRKSESRSTESASISNSP